MKEYERTSDTKLVRRLPMIVRLDGKAFHSWTKKSGCVRPFDHTFIDMMSGLAQYLCENIGGAELAYGQSDEISILVRDDQNVDTDAWFDKRLWVKSTLGMVGAEGFEPSAFWSRTKRATRLRYAPKGRRRIVYSFRARASMGKLSQKFGVGRKHHYGAPAWAYVWHARACEFLYKLRGRLRGELEVGAGVGARHAAGHELVAPARATAR